MVRDHDDWTALPGGTSWRCRGGSRREQTSGVGEPAELHFEATVHIRSSITTRRTTTRAWSSRSTLRYGKNGSSAASSSIAGQPDQHGRQHVPLGDMPIKQIPGQAARGARKLVADPRVPVEHGDSGRKPCPVRRRPHTVAGRTAIPELNGIPTDTPHHLPASHRAGHRYSADDERPATYACPDRLAYVHAVISG
jgi:hypothetical protein